MMTEPIVVAASMFLVTKVLASFIGWYLSDEGDLIARQHLRVLSKKFESHTLSELLHQVLTRLAYRVRKTLGTSKRVVIRLLTPIFLVNFFSIILAFPFFVAADRSYLETVAWLRWGLSLESFSSIASVFVAVLTLALLGTIFDFASASVTWLLVRRAAAAKSLKAAISHLSLDVVVAIVACGWAAFWSGFFIFGIQSDFVEPLAVLSKAWTLTVPYSVDLARGHWVKEHLPFAIIGLSAAIPTFAYATILIFSIAAHLTPRWFHRFVSRCVFLVTREETPVFARVGSVLGGAAAIVGAVANL